MATDPETRRAMDRNLARVFQEALDKVFRPRCPTCDVVCRPSRGKWRCRKCRKLFARDECHLFKGARMQ